MNTGVQYETLIYRLAGVSKIYRKGGRGPRGPRPGPGDQGVGGSPAGQDRPRQTTLLQILGGLDRPTRGRVEFGGQDLATS